MKFDTKSRLLEIKIFFWREFLRKNREGSKVGLNLTSHETCGEEIIYTYIIYIETYTFFFRQNKTIS